MENRDGWRRSPPEGYENLEESRCDPCAVAELRGIVSRREFPIYIFGGIGVGKSYLAALIHCRWSGVTSWMVRYADLIERAMRASKHGEIGPWSQIKETGLLIVDEIGIGMSNDWKTEIFWKILELRRGKPTILTGNLMPNELSDYFDERIKSRTIAGAIVQLCGRDQRRDCLETRMYRVGD